MLPNAQVPLRQGLYLVLLTVLFVLGCGEPAGGESVCRGTTSQGRLENGCKLPAEGANFTAYSFLGRLLGRTYVHCKVEAIVAAAYEEMGERQPNVRFVYGETGFAEGGPFKPHKTHQNGLSVDFFVPVRNEGGESVPLPTHALNKWGYNIEFDSQGRYDGLTIDFEAMTAHILALHRAAQNQGVAIWRVIFDPELQPFLRQTEAWKGLAGRVQFSTRRSWVRHDEHYHVDFEIPCKPI